jgi:hypothetical protein
MKHKINIPGILLALLVFISGNGLAISEHICNTSRTHDYSLFSEADCEIEKPQSSCCSKKMEKKNNCCEHKQLFSKLNIEGFIAKQLHLKSIQKEITSDQSYFYTDYFNQQITHYTYSGIPPPDNLHTIKHLLRPTPVGLQIFRC